MAAEELPYEDEDAQQVSATWAGSACRGPVAGRTGRGGSACHPEAVSAAITAVVTVEWRLMIEANTCRTHWQNGVENEKLEIICKKLDQIRQKIESK